MCVSVKNVLFIIVLLLSVQGTAANANVRCTAAIGKSIHLDIFKYDLANKKITSVTPVRKDEITAKGVVDHGALDPQFKESLITNLRGFYSTCQGAGGSQVVAVVTPGFGQLSEPEVNDFVSDVNEGLVKAPVVKKLSNDEAQENSWSEKIHPHSALHHAPINLYVVDVEKETFLGAKAIEASHKFKGVNLTYPLTVLNPACSSEVCFVKNNPEDTKIVPLSKAISQPPVSEVNVLGMSEQDQPFEENYNNKLVVTAPVSRVVHTWNSGDANLNDGELRAKDYYKSLEILSRHNDATLAFGIAAHDEYWSQ